MYVENPKYLQIKKNLEFSNKFSKVTRSNHHAKLVACIYTNNEQSIKEIFKNPIYNNIKTHKNEVRHLHYI